MARRLSGPRHLLRLVAIILLLMPGLAAFFYLAATLAGATREFTTLLVLHSAAPPIPSTAALALFLGVDALLALELTLVATVLTPLIGPLIFATLIGEAGPDPLTLALRLGGMVLGGLALGWLLRRQIGSRWITDNTTVFDGITTIAMVAFVVPLFDGVGAAILARPTAAASLMAVAAALNFGVHLVMRRSLRPRFGDGAAGALGLAGGTRSTALYLAAMPPDPYLALFVALAQFPIYATPLLF